MTHTMLLTEKITMFGNDMLTVAVGLICLFGCVLHVLLAKPHLIPKSKQGPMQI